MRRVRARGLDHSAYRIFHFPFSICHLLSSIFLISLTPLFRGVICGASICELFQQFHRIHETAKTVETVATQGSFATTQLKLGVNEKLLTNSPLELALRQGIAITGY
jgi:hypothetical protein